MDRDLLGLQTLEAMHGAQQRRVVGWRPNIQVAFSHAGGTRGQLVAIRVSRAH